MKTRKTTTWFMRCNCEALTFFAPNDAGMDHRSDDDQLTMASSSRRVLFGFNIRDYLRIHTEWMMRGQSHAGIVLAKQQAYSIGEQLRRLVRIIGAKSAEEMENQILFLSDWGEQS